MYTHLERQVDLLRNYASSKRKMIPIEIRNLSGLEPFKVLRPGDLSSQTNNNDFNNDGIILCFIHF